MGRKHPTPSVQIVRSGDILLYRGTSVMSWLIRVKTWSPVSHVEVAVSPGFAVASRDGEGVRLYPIRRDELYAILRPKAVFDMGAAMAWFRAEARGQGYDWTGLLNFYVARWQGRENGKMFCSEFATRFQRRGGVEPFAPGYDADAVSPGMFLSSPAYDVIVRL